MGFGIYKQKLKQNSSLSFNNQRGNASDDGDQPGSLFSADFQREAAFRKTSSVSSRLKFSHRLHSRAMWDLKFHATNSVVRENIFTLCKTSYSACGHINIVDPDKCYI